MKRIKLTKTQSQIVAALESGLTQAQASEKLGIPKYKINSELLFAATCNDLDYSTRALLAACRCHGFDIADEDWYTK